MNFLASRAQSSFLYIVLGVCGSKVAKIANQNYRYSCKPLLLNFLLKSLVSGLIMLKQ